MTKIRGYVDTELIKKAIKQWPEVDFLPTTSAQIDWVFKKALALTSPTEPNPTLTLPLLTAPTMKTLRFASKMKVEPQERRWSPADARERFGSLRPDSPFSSISRKS